MILDNKALPITMYRGDTFTIPAVVDIGADPLKYTRYELTAEDKFYVGIMEPKQKFEDAILRQTYTNESETTAEGDIIIKLSPEETENLNEGLYYIQCKLVRGVTNPVVTTVVPTTIFNII